MSLMYIIGCLLLTVRLPSPSAFSIDANADVVVSRPEVEVEVDFDPESGLQKESYFTSHATRPILESVSKHSVHERSVLINPPLKSADAPESLSTVLKREGFNFGRGPAYVTTKAVENGTAVLAIPMSQVMSATSAKRGRVGLLLEANPDLPPAIALGLHLLEERALGTASNFSDFIATLPPVTELNSTLFYSEDELSELEGSQLLRFTLGRTQAVEAFYDALVQPVTSHEAVNPPIFQEEAFTLTHFRWAMGVVWACAFQVSDDENDVVLAPVLDTIGLCTEVDDERDVACLLAETKVDFSTQSLVVYASAPYQAGQEVRLYMPGKSSSQLMLNHGFAKDRPSGKLDKVDVTVTLDPSDALAPLKNYLLHSQLNESVNATYAFYYGSSTIEQVVATSLKMKLLSGVELAHYKALLSPLDEGEAPDEQRIVSLRNEFVFTRAIISTCTALLKQYPSTMEQDQTSLAQVIDHDDVERSRRAHVLRILIMEKKILNETMEIALEEWKSLVFSTHPNLLDV